MSVSISAEARGPRRRGLGVLPWRLAALAVLVVLAVLCVLMLAAPGAWGEGSVLPGADEEAAAEGESEGASGRAEGEAAAEGDAAAEGEAAAEGDAAVAPVQTGRRPPAGRLEADPRSDGPPLPLSVMEVAERFLPSWRPLGEVRRFELARRGQTSFEQPVLAGACYAAVAWSASVRQLDADVFQAGERVGQDTRRDPWPVAEFCAPRTGSVRVVLHAVRGSGEVEALVVVDRQRMGRVRGDRDPLLNRLAALQARVAPGALPVTAPLQIALPGPALRQVALDGLGEGCWLAIALGEHDAMHLAMRVRDGEEGVRSEDRSRSPEAALWWCSDGADSLVLDLLTSAGSGPLVLQVLSLPGYASAPGVAR